MASLNDPANPAVPSADLTSGHDGSWGGDWQSRNRELKEEFFALMDQLADRAITPAMASAETARINREMATLIKLTLEKRRS